jgi:ACS family D-galactonate transporter-like MFS transporter
VETNQKPSRVRVAIVAMLFATTVFNYLDRSSISIVAPVIGKEMELNSVQLGLVFSAFAWAYSPLQIPGSMLVDRIKPRRLYPAVIALWSLMQMMLGFAGSLWQLFALRLGLGMAEAPSFPMNNQIVTLWLPERERAMAVGTSMGITLPIVIGYLVRNGDFAPALVFVGSMALLSAFSFSVIIGEVKRVE